MVGFLIGLMGLAALAQALWPALMALALHEVLAAAFLLGVALLCLRDLDSPRLTDPPGWYLHWQGGPVLWRVTRSWDPETRVAPEAWAIAPLGTPRVWLYHRRSDAGYLQVRWWPRDHPTRNGAIQLSEVVWVGFVRRGLRALGDGLER